MSRLDEARERLWKQNPAAEADLSLLLRSEALYRAEALAWREHGYGGLKVCYDARTATEAFEREMGGGRG